MKNHPQDFRLSRYWHPKFWPTWFLLGIMRLLSWLPYPVQQALGAGLGRLLYRMGGSRRRITSANIRACFPELGPQQQEQLVRDTFVANAKGYVECTVGWWRSARPYTDRLIVDGEQHVRDAQAAGKGILLIGGHFSILDFALPLVAHVAPVAYMYRPNDNPLLNAMIERSRRNFCDAAFTKKELRALIDYVRDGNMAWYAIDQDFGRKNTVFAPFFGVQASTFTTAAWLARETGAKVLFLSQFRESDRVYRLRFRPVEQFPVEDEVVNATILNRVLEEEIRRCPDQYLWLHRRFKTRPDGEPSIY